MSTYNTLQQLMNSFQHCLFFNLSDKEWKLPNGIARLLDVDDNGCCWFLFHVSVDDTGLYETQSPARIRLYEKGRDCYVEANGKAELLRDPIEWTRCTKISYGMAKALRYHGLIVRFRILQATVKESGRIAKRNLFQRMYDGINEWISGRHVGETVYPHHVLSH